MLQSREHWKLWDPSYLEVLWRDSSKDTGLGSRAGLLVGLPDGGAALLFHCFQNEIVSGFPIHGKRETVLVLKKILSMKQMPCTSGALGTLGSFPAPFITRHCRHDKITQVLRDCAIHCLLRPGSVRIESHICLAEPWHLVFAVV